MIKCDDRQMNAFRYADCFCVLLNQPGLLDFSRHLKCSSGVGDSLEATTAARFVDDLTLRLPFAPLPWRWTWTIVPLISAHSKPGFCECSVKMRSNMPFPAQRRKRIYGVMHLPKWGGQSYQDAPVRRRQSTASRNSRHDRSASGAKTAIRAACRERLHFTSPKDQKTNGTTVSSA